MMLLNRNSKLFCTALLVSAILGILVGFSSDQSHAVSPAALRDTAVIAETVTSLPADTAPALTEPEVTEPLLAEPAPTEPEPTEALPAEPEPTFPEESEPIHSHSYIKTVISPTTSSKGYTLCECDCGSSYKTNYVSKLTASFQPSVKVPDEMLNSDILQALAYLGVDVQKLKDNGVLLQTGYIASRTPSYAKSPVPYSRSGNGSGLQTIADSTTPTGLAPDVAAFKKTGLDCVDLAAYYLVNYLPNIKGADVSMLTEMYEKYKGRFGRCYDHMDFWPTACGDLASQGRIEMYTYEVGEDYSDVFSKIQPGALIQMGSKKDPTKHYAIYAGTYNGNHYIIHSGNVNRGPEISLINYMWDDGQSSWPVAFYEFNFPTVDSTG